MATDIPSIWQEVAVGDPDKPRNVIRPNPDGSINVVGDLGDLTVGFDSPTGLLLYTISQQLQQLVMIETHSRNALLLLLNLVDKRGNITIDDLQGVI